MADVVLQGIAKRFEGASTEVLKPIDLRVRAGEFLVLLGPSGCGKSTTLRIIAGLEAPTAGRVFIGGRDVTDLPPKERDIAMVFQSYALYPHLSVRDNLGFGLRVRGTPAKEIAARTAEAAEMLGLTELLDRRPKELSGGQRQRVAMGRALVRRPKVFLFDEPLSNLDANLRTQMRAEIARLHRQLGTTAIYVTHDQVEAMTLASRIVILEGGRVQQIGAPLEVYSRPDNGFVARFLGAPPMNQIVGAIQSGPVFAGGGIQVPLSLALAAHVGKKAVLGFRPQAMRSAKQGAVSGPVELVELTGGESFVRIRLSEGAHATARLDGATSYAIGDRAAFDLPPDDLHLFAYREGEGAGEVLR